MQTKNTSSSGTVSADTVLMDLMWFVCRVNISTTKRFVLFFIYFRSGQLFKALCLGATRGRISTVVCPNCLFTGHFSFCSQRCFIFSELLFFLNTACFKCASACSFCLGSKLTMPPQVRCYIAFSHFYRVCVTGFFLLFFFNTASFQRFR